MTFEPLSSSHRGGCDIEAIRQFWVGALQRLKVRAELAELEAMCASRAEQDSTRPIDGNQPQTESGQAAPKINSLHEDNED